MLHILRMKFYSGNDGLFASLSEDVYGYNPRKYLQISALAIRVMSNIRPEIGRIFRMSRKQTI